MHRAKEVFFMFKILLVEDEVKIRQLVTEALLRYQYDCLAPTEFDNVLQVFLDFRPHLVILDINLPTLDGFYWCQMIRQYSNVPVLFTSARNGQMDQIMGMTMGADDYMIKPYDLGVLQAKVSALLRRSYAYHESVSDVLSCEEAVLNLSTGTLTSPAGKTQLSRNELLILKCLMLEPKSIVSRDKLIEVLWEDESFIDDNTLTVNMTRLRKRLESIGLNHWIVTHKKMGYALL